MQQLRVQLIMQITTDNVLGKQVLLHRTYEKLKNREADESGFTGRRLKTEFKNRGEQKCENIPIFCPFSCNLDIEHSSNRCWNAKTNHDVYLWKSLIFATLRGEISIDLRSRSFGQGEVEVCHLP